MEQEKKDKKTESSTDALAAYGTYAAAALVSVCLLLGYRFLFKLSEHLGKIVFESHPAWSWLLSPACFAMAWALVHFIEPGAAGGSIPNVMAASEFSVHGDRSALEKVVGLRVIAIMAISTCLCLLGGGVIGREGPSIQMGAALFYFAAKVLRRHRAIEIQDDTVIIAGSAVGLTAAFNAPLGGIAFVIEEIARKRFSSFRMPLLFAVIASGLCAQSLIGRYFFFGNYELRPLRISQWPWFCMIAAITGIAGALFGSLFFSAVRWKNKKLKDWRRFAAFAALCGLAVASLGHLFGTFALGTGTDMITGMLAGTWGGKTVTAQPSWPLFRILGAMLTNLAGCAGGIFAPALASGAAIGSLFSSYVAPWAGNLDPRLMIMLGMIGFLTGMTHGPVTSFILIFEMTGQQGALIPMMLSAMVSHAAAKAISKESVYELIRDLLILRFRTRDNIQKIQIIQGKEKQNESLAS